MKKLSVKIGAVFFLCILGLESFMFFFLHSALVDSRVEEELSALQARGNSHRAILEKHFNQETIEHVALMETESTTDVLITDGNLRVLGSSNSENLLTQYVKLPSTDVTRDGMVIADNWESEPFIATVSPLDVDDKRIGYVYMFQHTETVHSLIKRLNQHFLLAGILTIALTFSLIALLSKALTRPLIDMKDATYQLSQGNYSISLPMTSDDELGDLAKSIGKLASELNDLKQERNDFLASISHELRTPLTYIKGYSEIVLKRDLPKDEQQSYLKIIFEESNRLAGLIKNLFDLAKIDRYSFAIEKTPMNLFDLLKGLELKLLPAFKEKELSLHVNCREDIYVLADPVRMEQILLNLLDNSMKYSISGGRTSVSIEKIEQNVHIQVSDDGKGIPEEELPRIFDRFYRVDKSRTRSLGGSGLGLAIVKELVHAHGGTISVKSELQKGTTFTIVLKGAE